MNLIILNYNMEYKLGIKDEYVSKLITERIEMLKYTKKFNEEEVLDLCCSVYRMALSNAMNLISDKML